MNTTINTIQHPGQEVFENLTDRVGSRFLPDPPQPDQRGLIPTREQLWTEHFLFIGYFNGVFETGPRFRQHWELEGISVVSSKLGQGLDSTGWRFTHAYLISSHVSCFPFPKFPLLIFPFLTRQLFAPAPQIDREHRLTSRAGQAFGEAMEEAAAAASKKNDQSKK